LQKTKAAATTTTTANTKMATSRHPDRRSEDAGQSLWKKRKTKK
jgi:hypothetical protein